MSVDFVFDGSAYTPPSPLPFNFAPATTYSFTASGGAVTGGDAVVRVRHAPPIGGDVWTDGTATVRRAFAFAGSGGAATGGKAGEMLLPWSRTRGRPGDNLHPGVTILTWAHLFEGQGGGRLGGSAVASFRQAPEPVTFRHGSLANEGTIRISGSAGASFTDTLANINAQDEELLLLGLFGSLAA